MHKRQVAAYVAGLMVFVACVAEAYEALFASPSTAPQEAAAGLAAVPPFSVTRLHEDVSVAPDPAAEQTSAIAAGQRDTSEAPISTIGKSELQSDEPGPSRADTSPTSADHQGRAENAGEGRRNGYQVRTVHRGQYYSNRRRNAGDNSFFGHFDNYARRDNSAFFHGSRDRNGFGFGPWAREGKNSRARQSRGVFGTFAWH